MVFLVESGSKGDLKQESDSKKVDMNSVLGTTPSIIGTGVHSQLVDQNSMVDINTLLGYLIQV